MSTGMASENSFFLSYDFDQIKAGTLDGVGNAIDDDVTYYLYAVSPVSADPNDGHSFDVVTSLHLLDNAHTLHHNMLEIM